MKPQPFTISILLTLALLVLTASAVVAAPPMDLHIEALEFVATDGEPFTATGSAVDAGLVCATGTIDDLYVEFSDSGRSPYRILHVLKRFYCDDFSGTFDIQMVVQLDLTTNETTARWKIVGGTDSYVNLKGRGALVGTPVVKGFSIQDVYDGMVH
jgi:hypothetical protein